MSANLLANGDFSHGATGFTTTYNKGGTSLVPTDTYAVGTNPQLYHFAGANFGDHTTGTGKMLMVNGSPLPGTTIWKEAIKVTPGIVYSFSGWAASWATEVTGTLDTPLDISPAQVQITLNGKPVSTTTLPADTGVWTSLTGAWLATSAKATIVITDLNTAVGGNDSAYDDLSFSALASVHGSVASASINAKGKPAAKHKALAGVTLYLDTNNDGVLDDGEITAVTNKAGAYVFTGLTAGTYTVCQMNAPVYDFPPAQLTINIPASKQLVHQNLLDVYTSVVPTAKVFR